MSTAPQRHQGADLSVIESAFRTCRGGFASVGFFSFFINVLMLTGPLFMLQVYDRVLTSQSLPTLVVLFVLVAGLFAFMGLLELIRSRILVRLSVRLDEQAKRDVFDAVVAHALQKTPDVKTQPIRDLATLRQFISGPGPALLFDMPWAPTYIAINWMFHWALGVFTLIAAIILAIMSVTNELLNRAPVSRAGQASAKANGLTEEARSHADVLKAMGMLGNFRARWLKQDQVARNFQTLSGDRGGLISAISKSLRMFLQSSILALAAALVIAGEMSGGAMVAASIILSRALAPLEQSIQQWRSVLGARKAYQRLKLLTGAQTGDIQAALQSQNMPLPDPDGQVDVATLRVVAPGSQQPILHETEFSLQPGAGLGVIGPSGAGKSSLLSVIAGLWPVDAGHVRLGGAAMSHYPAQQLGRFVGYLPQSVSLFVGSVKENIARLSDDPNPASVVKAAKLAFVHDFIQQLPEGYNTHLGAGGVTLSAGQQQRIALARAFYGDPVLVVLDEPNAHLDAEGEAALINAVKAMRKAGATVVIAAHRPSAIAALSQILMLDDGRQVDFGPREEVLKRVVHGTSVAAVKSARAHDRKIAGAQAS